MTCVLHVVPTYWPATRYGGTIVSTRALVGAQTALGDDVAVATTSVDGAADRSDLQGEARPLDGARVHYFPCGAPRRLYRSPAMAAWLRGNAARHDVIHAHAAFLWPTWAARRIAVSRGLPFIVSPRGMLVPELIAARGRLRKRAWIALVERGNLQQAAAIHVTSTRERDDLLRVVDGPLAPISVIPNGVRLPAASARPREAGLLLFIGRVSWKKRIDWAIRALQDSTSARLVVAGPDDEGLRPVLAALARDCGVADRVQFTGEVDAATRDEWLARAQALVLPSISENFGNVVVEAMASACPVVVTPGVGAIEHVLAANAGIAAVDDEAGFRRAIAQVLADAAAARAMGERGRAYAAATLAWPAVAQAMTALYRQAMADKAIVHAR